MNNYLGDVSVHVQGFADLIPIAVISIIIKQKREKCRNVERNSCDVPLTFL